jgi:nicotinamide riboside kinase
VPDGLQRDSRVARAAVEARLEAALHDMGARVVPIGGGWDERRAAAIAAIAAAWPGVARPGPG